MSEFTRDWTSGYSHKWKKWLQPFVGAKNVRGLEVGCFEGRSSKWFLDNILTDPSSSLTCVDFNLNLTFSNVVKPYGSKVQFYNVASNVALRSFPMYHFDFVYIDGSHKAPNVLEDAVLAFLVLKRGGVMIFDDYLMKSDTPNDPYTMPKMAIDSWLYLYKGKLDVIGHSYQVAVIKK